MKKSSNTLVTLLVMGLITVMVFGTCSINANAFSLSENTKEDVNKNLYSKDDIHSLSELDDGNFSNDSSDSLASIATDKKIKSDSDSLYTTEPNSKTNDEVKEETSKAFVFEDGTLIIHMPDGTNRLISFDLLGDKFDLLKLKEDDKMPEITVEPIPSAAIDNEVIKELEDDVQTSPMPTVEDYKGSSDVIRYKIEGTDKWNDLIYEIATEEGVDPVFIKCLIAQESEGDQYAVNEANKNGTTDYGLMMVNDSWGDIYDYDRILEDPEYAIRCGINVFKVKKDIALSFGKEATLFNVSWFYNGYSKDGKEYAKRLANIYKDMTGLDAKETYF